MTTPRLARAIASVVETKLAAGIAFLRVPEIVSPFPLAELLDALQEMQDTRYAVFLDAADMEPHPKLTLEVHEAILWRNDQRVTDNLVVIGDLERDRAAGLSSLPTVTAREVRQALLRQLTIPARRTATSAKTFKIMDALKNERLNLDLQFLADYCDHLEPHLGTRDLEEACAGLWYLKLLPDRVSADIDVKRLRDNQARVTELRQADATFVQRLIGALSTTSSGNYESLRMFASTGRREHLRNLQLEAVRDAVKTTKRSEEEEEENDTAGGSAPGQAERTDFLEAVRKDAIPEREFLEQIRADREDEGAGGRISAGGAKIDWDRVPEGQLAPLTEQDGDVLPYAVAAGSLEHMPADEADPLPGRGKVEWGDLRDVAKELRVLEEAADRVPDPRPSSILETVLALRLSLADWVTDIPREGLRLFLAAPTVADIARDLVSAWVSLWRSLDDLRGVLGDEVGELIALGNRLAVTDTRIVEQGTAVTAYLLPLHPMVLEPRVRAASMFREHPELDQDFFQIIQSALDPAVPSVKLPVGDTSFDLAYSGQFRGLPQYVRRSTQFHSADVVRAIQDSVDRFVNVHPYSKLSLRVALVDPTAETAKQMLKWLANVDPSRRERIALDVYAIKESPDEIQSKLAEGREDLVSAEISSSRFDYTMRSLNKLEELPAALHQSDRSPHVLCLFDPAVVKNTPVPVASLTPILGALVNEWEFGARAKKATPYIRPKTGSTALNDFLTAQSRLLGNDTHSATERNPLLQDDILAVLDKVSAETSWVVVAQGASALVAPPNIGEAELLGRTSSGSHTAYVYSRTPALVLEPVLAYLQQYQYIQSDPRLIMRFVLQTIRLALPEGLLGFYKRLGNLSKESVLGRLGLAAVVAYLQQDDEHDADLIVSLDTEGARRWLGLREGVNRRADLVRLAFGPEGVAVEAIEIKARSGNLVWGTSTPEVVVEATEQVEAMYALLQAIFSDERDLLVASRREILKRQVFLEALHQWEPIRERDPDTYRRQIGELNRLFTAPGPDRGLAPTISKRVFVATPGDDSNVTGGATTRRVGDVDVTQLGLQWFRTLLSDQPGTGIEIDADLLDLLVADNFLDLELTEVVLDGSVEPSPPSADRSQPAASQVTDAREEAASSEDVESLLQKLQQSFKARSVPYVSIGAESVEVGPSVVRVPVRLELGARSAQLESQSDDIARDLGVQSFRTSNLSGRPGYVVAEVPRTTRDIPDVETLTRPELPYPALAVGAGIDFAPYWQCLDDIPHLLVAGKTGSGKSVLIRSLLWQLTRLYEPSELELVLIGPKAADFMDFADAPHFRSPSDVHLRAEGAIDLLRDIVEVRYAERQATFDSYALKAMREGNRVSNLRELMRHAQGKGEQPPLRPFVVIIDEFVELLDSSPSGRKEFETLIARFSRLFRYIGGSMIAATQRPSVKSITGDIKANFRPLALRVERSVDSRVILDANGAEQLVGMGDCLYKADEGMLRLQAYAALGTYLWR